MSNNVLLMACPGPQQTFGEAAAHLSASTTEHFEPTTPTKTVRSDDQLASCNSTPLSSVMDLDSISTDPSSPPSAQASASKPESATKKQALTFAEREVLRIEKQFKTQEKAEEKSRKVALKETERREKEEKKRAEAEEKEAKRLQKEAEKAQKRREQDEAKEEKRRQTEEKRKLKEEKDALKQAEQAAREAEKKAKEDERAKRERVGRIIDFLSLFAN